MYKINLIAPKAEPMADKTTFILPLWRESEHTPFMFIKLHSIVYGRAYYKLKKVLDWPVWN